jgi:hypothetical protein
LTKPVAEGERDLENELERKSMEDELHKLIAIIKKDHKDLPKDYRQTISTIKNKLNIPEITLEGKALTSEQQKAIQEIKGLKDAESALKWAQTYATVMD